MVVAQFVHDTSFLHEHGLDSVATTDAVVLKMQGLSVDLRDGFVFLQVADAGMGFLAFDVGCRADQKLTLPLRSFSKLAKFFETEWPLLYDDMAAEIERMKIASSGSGATKGSHGFSFSAPGGLKIKINLDTLSPESCSLAVQLNITWMSKDALPEITLGYNQPTLVPPISIPWDALLKLSAKRPQLLEMLMIQKSSNHQRDILAEVVKEMQVDRPVTPLSNWTAPQWLPDAAAIDVNSSGFGVEQEVGASFQYSLQQPMPNVETLLASLPGVVMAAIPVSSVPPTKGYFTHKNPRVEKSVSSSSGGLAVPGDCPQVPNPLLVLNKVDTTITPSQPAALDPKKRNSSHKGGHGGVKKNPYASSMSSCTSSSSSSTSSLSSSASSSKHSSSSKKSSIHVSGRQPDKYKSSYNTPKKLQFKDVTH